MRVSRAKLAEMIPHAGAMSLLDGVLDWDDAHISCVSRTHREPSNPLRSRGRLSAVCAIEYAAQAVAVHGALTGATGKKSKGGYLASVREVNCHVQCLDEIAGELVVEAEKLAASHTSVMYGFTVRIAEVNAADGRLTVVLDLPS